MSATPEPRVPSEFRYWQHLDRPAVRRMGSVTRRVLGFDPAPPDEVVRTLAAMYYDADPPCEAFVDEVYLRQGTAAGALAQEDGQGRRLQHHQVVEASGDLAGHPALLGLPGERGAGGVDQRDQRQPQLCGQVHAAPGLAQRGRPERRRQ
jgi:hypothetical protein